MDVNRDDIAATVEDLFPYVDDGWISLRAFPENEDGPPLLIEPVKVGARITMIDAWVREAQRTANMSRPGVFCPPLAVFSNPDHAREVDLLHGVALSVECDKNPTAARTALEHLLGRATHVVESGGQWTDPETGEVQPKLHLHWRLTEPTADAATHAKLKEARRRAMAMVGGDPTNVPAVHPIRTAGSVHRKGEPRLARIVARHKEAEIDLDEALEVLPPVPAMRATAKPGVGTHVAEASGDRIDPRSTSELVANITSGREYHPSLVPLAMRFLRSGMADGLVVNVLKGLMESVPADKRDGEIFGRWGARFASIPEAVRTARGKLGEAPAEESRKPSPLVLTDPRSLAGREIRPREWIAEGAIPVGETTIFYGDGGVGKSLAALQLQCCTALARDWFGMKTTPCRSVGFYCEDDADELHRRADAICRMEGATLADLADCRWVSRVGEDNELVRFDPDGKMHLTPIWAELLAAAQGFGARLIIVDGAQDTYSGDENRRIQVRRFIQGACTKLARAIGGAVLLLAHPSRDGLKTGRLDGGSTSWNNSVRSRLTLARLEKSEDEALDDNVRVLKRAKSNYAGIDEEGIRIRWTQGAFMLEDALTPTVKAIRQGNVDKVFLRLLERTLASGGHVSNAPNSWAYAPKVFAASAGAEGFRKEDFKTAMARLMDQGRIKIGTVQDEHRNKTKSILPVTREEGVQDAA